MDWFRSRRTWGGGLALFALALQLVLSFGHIHAEDLAGKPVAMAALAQPGTPQGDTPGHDDDDKFCDICAALALLASGQVAAPPALILPVAFRAAPLQVASDSLVAAFHRAAFRSRAPPAA